MAASEWDVLRREVPFSLMFQPGHPTQQLRECRARKCLSLTIDGSCGVICRRRSSGSSFMPGKAICVLAGCCMLSYVARLLGISTRDSSVPQSASMAACTANGIEQPEYSIFYR